MTDDLSSENGSVSTVRNKIVFVGDVFVGKTSVMCRFIENKFKETYDSTVGVDFFSKPINYKGKTLVLQIWDSAGQERYKSLIPSYVRGASIIFIIYDVSKRETFTNVTTWINFIRGVKVDNTMIVLCGNKVDLERQVSTSEGEKYAQKEGLMFFEISAKNNINIKKMFFTALIELSFFEQFDTPKEKIISELEEENKEVNMSLDESAIGNIPQPLNLKEKKGNADGKCKC